MASASIYASLHGTKVMFFEVVEDFPAIQDVSRLRVSVEPFKAFDVYLPP